MNKNMQSGATKEEEKPTLVPKLRFPEFRDAALRGVLLGDVAEEGRSRNGNKHSVASVMGVTKADGIVPMEARLISADIARYKIVEKDWFAYNPMRLNIGSIARWKGEREILVSPDYVVFKCLKNGGSGMAPDYLDHFRQTEAWEEFVTESGDGGVRVRIYYKDIARIELALPSLPEQQKIAACLSSLDELIAAQARKVEALKTHKKGLMQQLFPGDGESQPRVRLPDFLDSDDWNENYLGRLVVIRSGNSPSRYELSHEGKYPFVKVEDLNNCEKYQEASREYSDEISRLIPKGSVLFPKRGAAIALNKIRLSNRELLMDTNMMALTPVDGCLPEFLFYLISQVGLDKIADNSTIPQINNKHIIPFAVLIPELEEQQRIADCLTSLDELITAATQELDTLKIHKKALMQQLFPAQEEMAA